MKRTLVYSVRAETRRQRAALFGLSWECACQASQIFQCFVKVQNDHKSAVSIDLGITNFSE